MSGIIVRQADASCLETYDKIPMIVSVDRILKLETPRNGLGGMRLKEEDALRPYRKDFGRYEQITRLPQRFCLDNWAFFLAYDGRRPVGGAIVAARTPGVHMLEGRDDLCVLWDIRVAEECRGQGIGSRLFEQAAQWGRAQGMRQMKIESQNNNVRAAHFYAGKGAVLGAMNTHAYQGEPEVAEEIQLIWYLDL
ncbi:GNAT family N-acetyltransferase [Christensenellaceae bacterium 44-20]